MLSNTYCLQDLFQEKLLPKRYNITELFSAFISGTKRKNSNDITGSYAMRKKSSVSDGNAEDNDSEPEIIMYSPSWTYQETELQSPAVDNTDFHLSHASISSALVESMSCPLADGKCSTAPLATEPKMTNPCLQMKTRYLLQKKLALAIWSKRDYQRQRALIKIS